MPSTAHIICNLHTFDFSEHWFRLCVEFTVKPDKVDAFHEEFSKCVAISVKEAGCKQVRPSNVKWKRPWNEICNDILKNHF